MTSYIREIVLELSAGQSIQYVDAKQGDDGSRQLLIRLEADGQPYIIGDDVTPILRVRKPDGHSAIAATSIQGENIVQAELSAQMLAVAGVADADLCLTSAEGKILSTASFYIRVRAAALGENLPSTNDFGEFMVAACSAISAAENAEKSAKYASDAEQRVSESERNVSEYAIRAEEASEAALEAKKQIDDNEFVASDGVAKGLLMDANNIYAETPYGDVFLGRQSTSVKIQIFGDSATSETWNGPKWPSLLQTILPEYALNIVNSAIGGNTLVHWPRPDIGLEKGVAWQIGLTEATAGVPEHGSNEDTYAPLLTDRDLVIAFAGGNEWGGGGSVDIIGSQSELFRDGEAAVATLAYEETAASYVAEAGSSFKLYAYSSDQRFFTRAYKVIGGQAYRIHGTGVRHNVAIPLGMYTTASDIVVESTTGSMITADDGSINLNTNTNVATDYDFQFTPEADGFIIISGVTLYPALSVDLPTQAEEYSIKCIYGAVRRIVEVMAEKCPNSKLLFLTPMQRFNADDATRPIDPETGNALNAGGFQLVEVVDAIVDACAYYGIPCVDMYRTLGFNRYNFQPGGPFTADGLHPNAAGDLRIAKIVSEKIKEMI